MIPSRASKIEESPPLFSVSLRGSVTAGVSVKIEPAAAAAAPAVMPIIMPIIMGIFTLFYNAAFGLYIVAGVLIALITGPLVTLFVDMLEIEAIKKEQNSTVASYDRKRRK